MREAFYRQNLPNVTNLLATCLFVLIAISFQGLSTIVLPVRTYGVPRFQVNYLIKISNILYGPIILHRLLVSFLYSISKVVVSKSTCCYVSLIPLNLPVKTCYVFVSLRETGHFYVTVPTAYIGRQKACLPWARYRAHGKHWISRHSEKLFWKE